MNFKGVMAVVLSMLGISSFAKDKDGKSMLTEDQKKQLSDKYGEKFATEFEKDLKDYEGNGGNTNFQEIQEQKKKLEDLQAEYDAYKTTSAKEKKDLEDNIAKLSGDSEEDQEPENPKSGANVKKSFAVDTNLLHNKVMENYINGDGLQALAADTIDTQELRTEFGKYISDQKYEIIQLVFGSLTSTSYMTTKMSEKTEWRATQGLIDSVIQQFTPYWTPRGQTKFTPLTIVNRKHKINLPIKPAEIMEDVLGYLYDESLQPKDMPIVKYIIEKMLKPQVEEDRETLLATGVYEDFNPEGGLKDGIDGQAFGKSMDGYCTILKLEKEAGNNKITWLLDGVEITPENILEKIQIAVDNISSKFKKKSMCVHIDPDLYTMYKRAYQDKYKYTKNDDKDKDRIDFTKQILAPLDGMIGTKMFFITPKQNFIHLLSKNKGLNKIWMQGENYDVKVFGEWWEATGFAIAEAVFAYVPPVPGSTGGQSA